MKPDLSQNANRFIIFSVFFTARAYYPVLAILFIDLGLSLDQFVLLNLIWAATIFLFEVPSGALADIDVSADERRRIAEAGFYSYQ